MKIVHEVDDIRPPRSMIFVHGVFMELYKQVAWSKRQPQLFHFGKNMWALPMEMLWKT